MANLDADIERLVAQTKGEISRGQLLAAITTAMKIGGEAAAALSVAAALCGAGMAVAVFTAGYGVVITPWILQAVQHLMHQYLELDTEQRKAVATLVGFARGQIHLQ